jgi:hypothetical protein
VRFQRREAAAAAALTAVMDHGTYEEVEAAVAEAIRLGANVALEVGPGKNIDAPQHMVHPRFHPL